MKLAMLVFGASVALGLAALGANRLGFARYRRAPVDTGVGESERVHRGQEAAGRPMKTVYSLREELRANPQLVAKVQALTLNPEKPAMGLEGAHGLYGSDEWWQSIEAGRIEKKVIVGTITELFFWG